MPRRRTTPACGWRATTDCCARARMAAAEGRIRLRAAAALGVLRRRRLRGDVQTIPAACQADRAAQDAGRKTGRQPQRRSAGRRGERLVLGPRRRGHLPRDAGGRHRPHPVEQPADPETLRRLNALGVLTSRYDIYQDVMDPANFPKLRVDPPRLDRRAAWPKDLMLDARGQWVRGWEVEGKDGRTDPCGVLCDRQALDYARRRIPAELKTHPYRCRFIDTTTASPWRECYDADHPMTRSESRHWKMELLGVVERGVPPGDRQRDGPRGGRALRALFRGHAEPGAVPRGRRRPEHAADRGGGAPSRSPSSRPATSTACRCGNWSITIAWWPSGTGATTTTSCRKSGTAATCSTPSTARRRCSCSTASCGRPNGSDSCRAIARPPRSPAPPATRRCSRTAG